MRFGKNPERKKIMYIKNDFRLVLKKDTFELWQDEWFCYYKHTVRGVCESCGEHQSCGCRLGDWMRLNFFLASDKEEFFSNPDFDKWVH